MRDYSVRQIRLCQVRKSYCSGINSHSNLDPLNDLISTSCPFPVSVPCKCPSPYAWICTNGLCLAYIEDDQSVSDKN